ncbi:MAG TPA: phosphotransferase [Gaiellaceae bacterium]|nr:phosphotransferase [Gaiellaceae bacterium]
MQGLEERLTAVVGACPVAWTERAGGYSTAECYSVELDDGRRVFVKAAEAEHMARWIRREHEVYSSLAGTFIPELLGFDDDGARPLLVLEDLSHADWGRDWTEERIGLVRAALRELQSATPPPNTHPVRETFSSLFGRWLIVEEDPEPFLSLGLRSRGWLEQRLPALIAAADTAQFDGDALVHMDIRSDNLCTLEGRAVFVDWNWLSFGMPELDLVGWSCSLALEGGPKPWELLPERSGYAAFVAGIFAAVAGLPPPDTAPTVRAFQAEQLTVALDWVDREL